MQDYRKLQAWQRAQDACVRLYKLTGRYPAHEQYGLTTQLRRAGVSVGANLAEGSKRSTDTDKARLWTISLGSAAEIMSELDVAIRLAYDGRDEATALSNEYDQIAAMINALVERVKARNKR